MPGKHAKGKDKLDLACDGLQGGSGTGTKCGQGGSAADRTAQVDCVYFLHALTSAYGIMLQPIVTSMLDSTATTRCSPERLTLCKTLSLCVLWVCTQEVQPP